MGKVLTLFIVLVVLTGVIVWAFNRPLEDNRQNTTVTPTVNPTTAQKPTTDAPQPTAIKSQNISVEVPAAEQTIGRFFEVKGEARVFENIVSYRLKNRDSNEVILSGTTTADSPDIGQFGDFTITINLTDNPLVKNDAKLLLEVFQASPRDGSDTDLVSIPLTYQEGA